MSGVAVSLCAVSSEKQSRFAKNEAVLAGRLARLRHLADLPRPLRLVAALPPVGPSLGARDAVPRRSESMTMAVSFVHQRSLRRADVMTVMRAATADGFVGVASTSVGYASCRPLRTSPTPSRSSARLAGGSVCLKTLQSSSVPRASPVPRSGGRGRPRWFSISFRP
jgi:hypothetical protein